MSNFTRRNYISYWVEALGIFAKYATQQNNIAYLQDREMTVEVHPNDVSSEDIERLKALGWYADENLDNFYHFNS